MKLPLPPARSLGNKLALVFFAVIAVAFSVIFFFVVPQLQSNLEQQRVKDLRRVVPVFTPQLQSVLTTSQKDKDVDDFVRSVGDSSGAEVTVWARSQNQLWPKYSSRATPDSSASRALAAWVSRTGHIEAGVESSNGQRSAQAAVPVRRHGAKRPSWIAVYTRDLGDVQDAVSLIRTRVLIACGIALLIALVGGYMVARAVAKRVRRLETAAKQVADGKFIEPLPEDSEDELGQLTRTFNEMQVQLARVDSARREFIANASHELRTPIFSLGGFVELLQDEDLDEETRTEFLWLMREQVERLQKLAVSLLDLSRIDAGSLELNPEDVDLSELAREVAGEFTPAVSRHHTRLQLRLPARDVEAICDRERVAQIMRILLDNALRHTPEGTRVTVSADRINGTAELTVADSGPGVPATSADRVFERFYTGDAARGSGLGLAIARELADRMSGRIELRSAKGLTAFTLELPAVGDDGNGNGSA
ncbi:MAG TPA: HAMP domain-containing sensor histidine kinase [Thermoleophilaceae bacterium]|jgi:signal transduction histidine kinase